MTEKAEPSVDASDTERAGLRKILLGWDPIGVTEFHDTEDEYDCLIPRLMALRREGASVQDVSAWLQEQLVEHFGLEPEALEDEVAARIVALRA